VADSFEYSNEISCSIKVRVFLDKLVSHGVAVFIYYLTVC